MHSTIEKIKKARLFLLAQISDLTAAQLNTVPAGFNNNIAWNLGHLVCAQQGLCYLRAGQAAVVAEKYIAPFFTNSKPEGIIEPEEIAVIKSLYIDTMDQLQTDYERKLFGQYTPSPNVLKLYGIELKTIDDALEFLLYHEGYHAGCILALKKLVK